MRRLLALVAASCAAGAAGCERDRPQPMRPLAPGGGTPQVVRQVDLVPGPATAPMAVRNPYDGDAQALAHGRRLYGWMNCVGCHFEGGGGMGPPLMDDQWIYGGRPDQIFDSIASGRANGMPAYGERLAADQIWLLVLYVESLAAGDTPGAEGEDPWEATGGGQQGAGGQRGDDDGAADKAGQGGS